jgi:hypothetical protein
MTDDKKAARRGWAEVIQNELAGTWDVYDWSEHHDSGACVSSHETEKEAALAAIAWAAANGRKCIVEVPE